MADSTQAQRRVRVHLQVLARRQVRHPASDQVHPQARVQARLLVLEETSLKYQALRLVRRQLMRRPTPPVLHPALAQVLRRRRLLALLRAQLPVLARARRQVRSQAQHLASRRRTHPVHSLVRGRLCLENQARLLQRVQACLLRQDPVLHPARLLVLVQALRRAHNRVPCLPKVITMRRSHRLAARLDLCRPHLLQQLLSRSHLQIRRRSALRWAHPFNRVVYPLAPQQVHRRRYWLTGTSPVKAPVPAGARHRPPPLLGHLWSRALLQQKSCSQKPQVLRRVRRCTLAPSRLRFQRVSPPHILQRSQHLE